MAGNRPKILHITAAAIEDAVRSFREVRFLYFMLFLALCLFVFSLISPGFMFDPDGTIPPSKVWMIVPIIGVFFLSIAGMLPAIIGMARYFIANDKRYGYRFGRPFWRILGWWTVLTIVAILAIALIIWVGSLFKMVPLPDGKPHPRYMATMYLYGMVVMIFWYWLMSRLFTFFGALALDERNGVLRRSFRETRGHVFYIILNLITWSAVISTFVTLAFYGAAFIGGFTASIDTLLFFEQGMYPLTIALGVVGVLGLVFLFLASIGLQIALYGRVFRAIRGPVGSAPQASPPPLPTGAWGRAV